MDWDFSAIVQVVLCKLWPWAHVVPEFHYHLSLYKHTRVRAHSWDPVRRRQQESSKNCGHIQSRTVVIMHPPPTGLCPQGPTDIPPRRTPGMPTGLPEFQGEDSEKWAEMV